MLAIVLMPASRPFSRWKKICYARACPCLCASVASENQALHFILSTIFFWMSFYHWVICWHAFAKSMFSSISKNNFMFDGPTESNFLHRYYVILRRKGNIAEWLLAKQITVQQKKEKQKQKTRQQTHWRTNTAPTPCASVLRKHRPCQSDSPQWLFLNFLKKSCSSTYILTNFWKKKEKSNYNNNDGRAVHYGF